MLAFSGILSKTVKWISKTGIEISYMTKFTLPYANRSSYQTCSLRKGVPRNFAKFFEKYLCQSLFFNKVAGLRLAALLKRRFWHKCFPVNLVKLLRTLNRTPLDACFSFKYGFHLWLPTSNKGLKYDFFLMFSLLFNCQPEAFHFKTTCAYWFGFTSHSSTLREFKCYSKCKV